MRRWAQGLTMFRFMGSHPKSGSFDKLKVALCYKDETGLKALFDTLEQPFPDRIREGEKTLEDYRGQKIPIDLARSLRSRIPSSPHLAAPEPSWCTYRGHSFSVFFPDRQLGVIHLSVMWNERQYYVTERDFAVCQVFETQLEPFRDCIVDPPSKRTACVCPKYWPELWSGAPIDWKLQVAL